MKTKIDKRDTYRYKVRLTGEKIRGTVIDSHGSVKDVITGKCYFAYEIDRINRRHMVQLGFHIWRFGLYLFAREYLKYNSWFIVPGVSVDAVNGYDRYLDIEIKLLCIGFGIRFIWIKSKKIEK